MYDISVIQTVQNIADFAVEKQSEIKRAKIKASTLLVG